VFSSLSPHYASLPSLLRRSRQAPRALQTALARIQLTRDSRRHHSAGGGDVRDHGADGGGGGQMSRSMDERCSSTRSQSAVEMPATAAHCSSSSPDLGAFAAGLQRKSRSLAAAISSSAHRSLPRLESGRRLRQSRRVAQHVSVTAAATADSSEPQLVGLRRFCDDYRTSCLQQGLTARRLSLDHLTSTRPTPRPGDPPPRLTGVAEAAPAAGLSAGVATEDRASSTAADQPALPADVVVSMPSCAAHTVGLRAQVGGDVVTPEELSATSTPQPGGDGGRATYAEPLSDRRFAGAVTQTGPAGLADRVTTSASTARVAASPATDTLPGGTSLVHQKRHFTSDPSGTAASSAQAAVSICADRVGLVDVVGALDCVDGDVSTDDTVPLDGDGRATYRNAGPELSRLTSLTETASAVFTEEDWQVDATSPAAAVVRGPAVHGQRGGKPSLNDSDPEKHRVSSLGSNEVSFGRAKVSASAAELDLVHPSSSCDSGADSISSDVAPLEGTGEISSSSFTEETLQVDCDVRSTYRNAEGELNRRAGSVAKTVSAEDDRSLDDGRLSATVATRDPAADALHIGISSDVDSTGKTSTLFEDDALQLDCGGGGGGSHVSTLDDVDPTRQERGEDASLSRAVVNVSASAGVVASDVDAVSADCIQGEMSSSSSDTLQFDGRATYWNAEGGSSDLRPAGVTEAVSAVATTQARPLDGSSPPPATAVISDAATGGLHGDRPSLDDANRKLHPACSPSSKEVGFGRAEVNISASGPNVGDFVGVVEELSSASCIDNTLQFDGRASCAEGELSDALDDSVGSCVTVSSYLSSATDEPPPCPAVFSEDQLSCFSAEIVAGCITAVPNTTPGDDHSDAPTFDGVADCEGDCPSADAEDCASALRSMTGGDLLDALTVETVPDSPESVDCDRRQITDTTEGSVYNYTPWFVTDDVLSGSSDDVRNSLDLLRKVVDESCGACVLASGTSSLADLEQKIQPADSLGGKEMVGVADAQTELNVSTASSLGAGSKAGASASSSTAGVTGSEEYEPSEQRHPVDDWSSSPSDPNITHVVLLNVDDEETWL